MLAEALVLSGMAMAVAGSSRPASGGCHEILHAIDQLYPGTGNHGELAGVGALFCTYLRGDDRRLARCSRPAWRRHGLPRTPADLGPEPGRVHQGGAARPGDPAGPVHDPGAPRAGRGAIAERVEDFAAAFGSER